MNRIAILVAGAVLVLLGAWGAYAYMRSAPVASPTVATTTISVSTSTAPVTPTRPIVTTHSAGSLTLSIGQKAQIADLTLTPLAVTQDSRCPIDVQCIQAGTVSVSVHITGSNTDTTQVITLNKTVTFGNDTVTLTSVRPVKRSTVSIAPSEYRFTFDVEKKAVAQGKCYVGGCSGEVCSDQSGAVSSCIYRPEFGCYRTAVCERQTSGSCGWTQTDALKSCLANPPGQEYTL